MKNTPLPFQFTLPRISHRSPQNRSAGLQTSCSEGLQALRDLAKRNTAPIVPSLSIFFEELLNGKSLAISQAFSRNAHSSVT
jgi:hypothetical protein